MKYQATMLSMPMPQHLAKWWAEHPERWRGRPHYRRPRPRGFPHDGTFGERHRWFVEEFLRLAVEAISSRERAKFLSYAANLSLKRKSVPEDEKIQAEYRAHLERMEMMKLSHTRPGPIRAKPTP